jgi:hypothetical protein
LLISNEIKIVSERGWFLIHWLMATIKKTKSEPKKTNAAFLKPVTPDDKLAAVVGAHPAPHRIDEQALGLHQGAQAAGSEEENDDQRRR